MKNNLINYRDSNQSDIDTTQAWDATPRVNLRMRQNCNFSRSSYFRDLSVSKYCLCRYGSRTWNECQPCIPGRSTFLRTNQLGQSPIQYPEYGRWVIICNSQPFSKVHITSLYINFQKKSTKRFATDYHKSVLISIYLLVPFLVVGLNRTVGISRRELRFFEKSVSNKSDNIESRGK